MLPMSEIFNFRNLLTITKPNYMHLVDEIFICADRLTDRHTQTERDRQTDKQIVRKTEKHPQSCSENKPLGKPNRLPQGKQKCI